MLNFIAAHSLVSKDTRPISTELLRAATGQHQAFDRQYVREQLNTPEIQSFVNEIQTKVQLLETLHCLQNNRRQNEPK